MTTLKARLGMICAFLATALIIVGVTAYVSLFTVSETYDHVATINLPNATLLEQMATARGNSIRQMVRLGYPNIDAAEIAKLVGRFEEFNGSYDEADKKYQAVPFVEGESQIYDLLEKSKRLSA